MTERHPSHDKGIIRLANRAAGCLRSRHILLKAIVLFFWAAAFYIIFAVLPVFPFHGVPVPGIQILYSYEKPLYLTEFHNLIPGSNDSLLEKELLPNSTARCDGGNIRLSRVTHISINKYGQRDREYPPEKNGTFRIAVLGDSFTFGQGVEQDETYPKYLEEMLNSEGGGRYEVINFGVPGYRLTNELQQLKVRAMAFDPDLVIVGVTLGNDFKDSIESAQRRDCSAYKDWCDSRLSEPISGFGNISRESGLPIIFVMLVMDSSFYLQGEDLVGRYAMGQGMDFIPSSYVVGNEPDAIRFSIPGDGHPSAEGNRNYAAKIYKYLAEKKYIVGNSTAGGQ